MKNSIEDILRDCYNTKTWRPEVHERIIAGGALTSAETDHSGRRRLSETYEFCSDDGGRALRGNGDSRFSRFRIPQGSFSV